MRKSKIWAFAGTLMMLLCFSMAGGSMAYLSTAPKPLKNVITVGSVEIQLEEKSWNPEQAKSLHPCEAVPKDPAVSNTGKNSAWVFLEVSVPLETVTLVNDEGHKEQPSLQELFVYKPDETAWQLIGETRTEKTVCRVYAFRQILKPGDKTPPLFTDVTAVNYLEGTLPEDERFDIHITAKAIQDQVNTQDQSPEQIYEEYLRQEAAD